jgi:2-phosphosulfolactate phosphatase
VHITVINTPVALPAALSPKDTYVAVDVLRNTSSILAALTGGQASQIYPARTVSDAMALKQRLEVDEQGDVFTAGEVNSLKPPELDMDNSPAALFKASKLAGKRLIMVSTNGTILLNDLMARGARQILIGSFPNLKALATLCHRLGQDVQICCSGSKGKVSLEDSGFAGALTEALQERVSVIQQGEGIEEALSIWHAAQRRIDRLFAQAPHAKELQHLGKYEDLAFVSSYHVDAVPMLSVETGCITVDTLGLTQSMLWQEDSKKKY